MFPGSTLLAHALTGMSVTVPVPPPPSAIELPSDGMRKVIRLIELSDYSVFPGPQVEAVLHGALFRSTEHLYDL